MRPLPAALALLLAAGPAAAQDGICARDVLVARSSLQTARDRLERVRDDDPAASCRAWRDHVATMRRAAGIFGRCLTGAERARDLGYADAQAKEFEGLVRQRCR